VSGIVWNHGSGGSGGGTELAARQLERRMPAELLDRFQIFPSHYIAELADSSKIPVLWCHHSHEASMLDYLGEGGWRRFARIIFVSNWQARHIVSLFDIPWSRCVVIPNAIGPVPGDGGAPGPVPADTPLRLVYTSVPDRGLPILAAVFDEICKHRDDVELDVFSTFALYGEAWAGLDDYFDQTFEMLRGNPRVRCHGPVPNGEVLAALSKAHLFAYPALIREVSCMSLMEAMCAGLVCVHPDYGALAETAAGWTWMYEHLEDQPRHAERFYVELMVAIATLRSGDQRLAARLAAQKAFADEQYGWDRRAPRWESVLRAIVAEQSMAAERG
jgi:UDP-glucose:(glucosyl)LPS alpha-1,2-glucosyltransferase